MQVAVETKRAQTSRTPKSSLSGATGILIIGASFKTSPLAFRERLADAVSRGSRSLGSLPGAKEFVSLVTCNRIELTFATVDSDATQEAFFSWCQAVASSDEESSFYVYKDIKAIKHLFEVASGLDSMVTGEEQILAQVETAGVQARSTGTSKGALSALFDAAVNAGKRVRSSSARMPPAGTSVSAFALRLALREAQSKPRRVLLIGSGKTIRLAASALDDAEIFVSTRRTRGMTDGLSHARLVKHKDLARVARDCDLVISATKNRGFVLKPKELRDDDRPRTILDLAFPRNIDPALRRLKFTKLYDLDDIARAARSTPVDTKAVGRARRMIEDEAVRFSRWFLASKLTPTLSNLYTWAEEVRTAEADAALRRLTGLTETQKKVVQAMSKRLVSKLLAPPTQFAKASSPELPQSARLAVVESVFQREEAHRDAP